MFRKFTIEKTLLQKGLLSMDPYLEEAILKTRMNNGGFKQLSPQDQVKFDMWFGCKNIESWKAERCPYYRIYPGVVEALLKLKLDKLLDLERPRFPFGITTLEIELPKDYWSIFDCTSVIVGDLGEYYSLTLQRQEGKYIYAAINIDNIKNDLKKASEITNKFTQLIFGVLAIGDNPDIVKPLVLRADVKKYKLTGDEKYIEKARRRGVIGFDIGEDIPTKAQLKKMIEENELALEQGRKAPHIRCAHLHLYHTGKGRTIPKIMLIDSLVVNRELLSKIPQGFYEGD